MMAVIFASEIHERYWRRALYLMTVANGDCSPLCAGVTIPLAIMTSDDTHSLTVQLLKDHDNFGMAEGQISIMKQNKVRWAQVKCNSAS